MTDNFISYLDSPIGILSIGATNTHVVNVGLQKEMGQSHSNDISLMALKQLEEYFASQRTVFELPLEPVGTAFQKRVWEFLITIPYGKVATYKEVALNIANNKTIRAVGTANGANPIPIIVPCHRVIGSDGSLTGFALGISVKKWLLNHENPHRFAPQGSLF